MCVWIISGIIYCFYNDGIAENLILIEQGNPQNSEQQQVQEDAKRLVSENCTFAILLKTFLGPHLVSKTCFENESINNILEILFFEMVFSWVSEGLTKACTDVFELGCFRAVVFKKLLLKTVYRKHVKLRSSLNNFMGFCFATCDYYSYTEFSSWTINMFNAGMLRREGKWCLVRFCLLKHVKDVSSHIWDHLLYGS